MVIIIPYPGAGYEVQAPCLPPQPGQWRGGPPALPHPPPQLGHPDHLHKYAWVCHMLCVCVCARARVCVCVSVKGEEAHMLHRECKRTKGCESIHRPHARGQRRMNDCPSSTHPRQSQALTMGERHNADSIYKDTDSTKSVKHACMMMSGHALPTLPHLKHSHLHPTHTYKRLSYGHPAHMQEAVLHTSCTHARQS